MRTRIGTQVIVGVGLVTAVTIGVMAVVILRSHRAQLVDELKRGANQLSETIKSSTHYDMLENRRDNLHRQIETIGRQEGIEKVRLFNKDGQVMFSSDPTEIGRSLDKNAEACYACHAVGEPLERLPIPARARVFRGPDDHRVLGIINPIHNERGCWEAACHAHREDASVLGVLDVNVSLADVDRDMAAAQRRMVGLVVLTIAASSALLWWLNRRLVIGPAKALLLGTSRVAEGDLTTTIPVTSSHELGDLARAFNSMTLRLAEAQRQIAQSDKLASVGRLAAGVAHEINNPLTGVLTYASFLSKRAQGDPETKQDLDVIVRETKRCREIVKGLLDFARQAPPLKQPNDANVVIRRAVAILMNQLSLDHVSLTLDLAEDLPTILADGNQLQQVVTNLVLNAADAVNDAGGSIRISTRQAAIQPFGHAQIRAATCPRGCNLLDAAVRIGGLAAIRVVQSWRGREVFVHMDPVYGRFNHLAAEGLEEGAVATHACPGCRKSLDTPAVPCAACGSLTFAVIVPGRGQVVWCARKGCHWSRWETAEAAGSVPTIEIEIEDNGRGIATRDLAHLFEPFFSTKGTRGTGLGLAVSWGIVEGHGGTIEVRSEEGRGSCFTVRLPVEPAAEPAAVSARA